MCSGQNVEQNSRQYGSDYNIEYGNNGHKLANTVDNRDTYAYYAPPGENSVAYDKKYDSNKKE